MNIKELINKIVLDKNANELGKIDNAELNTETGKIESIDISVKKSVLSSADLITVKYEDIATFGQYLILSTEITEEDEEIEKTQEE